MQELINLRHRDGALRPVPEKSLVYTTDLTAYQNIWIHDQDGVNNWIGLKTDESLVLVDPSTGAEAAINDYSSLGTVLNVLFLKRFMIVLYEDAGAVSNMHRYIWKDAAYSLISLFNFPPVLAFNSNTEATQITDTATTAEGLLGKYKIKLKFASDDSGSVEGGGVMLRVAYRLFDGSFFMATPPVFFKTGTYTKSIVKSGSAWYITFKSNTFYGVIPKVSFAAVSMFTDIISSVVVFASKVESLYGELDTLLTDSMLASVTGTTSFTTLFPVNSAFKALPDSPSWYRIGELSLVEVCNVYGSTSLALDTGSFYHDFATRETLDVDQYSHHALSGKSGYVYNSRLILSNTDMKLANYVPRVSYPYSILNMPLIFQTKAALPSAIQSQYADVSYDTMFLVELQTTAGTKKEVYAIGTLDFVYKYSSPNTHEAIMPPVWSYPDSRAIKLSVVVYNGGNWVKVFYIDLIGSKFDNYAYAIETGKFDGTKDTDESYNYPVWRKEFEINTAEIININTVAADNILSDENRVQVSDVINPFSFPAKYSYQVGTGSVICTRANTEPLSSGQFGQFPLTVFTSKGIWAMEQGQGDILFASIVPVSGDVVADEDSCTPVGIGVTYTTSRGLYMSSGKEVVELSQAVRGVIDSDITSNKHVQYFTSTINLVEMNTFFSTDDFLTYLGGAKIAFCKTQNELIVYNSAYLYAYVYSFESNFWYKIIDSFSLIVNEYPDLKLVGTGGVYSYSTEKLTGSRKVLFISRPQSFDLPEIFKKIERMLLISNILPKNSTYIGIYVFQSNSLSDWQFINGSQRGKETGEWIKNILLQRSHGSSKFYVLMFAGEVDVNSEIGDIQLMISRRINNKLR